MKSRKRKSEAATSEGGRAKEKPQPVSTVVLASHCAVKDAVALKTLLSAVAAEALPVILDIGNVQRVDTATVQLLCVFAKDRRARGLKIEWRGASAVFEEAVKLLGVGLLLGFPDAGATV